MAYTYANRPVQEMASLFNERKFAEEDGIYSIYGLTHRLGAKVVYNTSENGSLPGPHSQVILGVPEGRLVGRVLGLVGWELAT